MNEDIEIPLERFEDHFMELLEGTKEGGRIELKIREREDKNESIDVSDLNEDFHLKEVENEIRKLKKGKAQREDGIINEFLKILKQDERMDIWFFLNRIWRSSKIPQRWRLSEIVPIYKKGSRTDTKNYRGVSLLSTFYKTYVGIIARRLKLWVEKNKVLSEAQAGFRENRGVRDQVFILRTIIDEKIKRSKGNVFIMFVDFAGAFDKIDRTLLCSKLRKIGVRGRILDAIEDIYEETRSRIKIGEEISAQFYTNKGVRQGCPLSPVLFNLFIDDLEMALKKGAVEV